MTHDETRKPGEGVAPCKDCKRRKVGCHSICEDYRNFQEAKIKLNRIKAKMDFLWYSYTASKGRTVKEWLKGRHDKWRK